MATFLTATAERPQPPRNAGASSPSRVEDAQFPGVDACDALPNGVVAADVPQASLPPQKIGARACHFRRRLNFRTCL